MELDSATERTQMIKAIKKFWMIHFWLPKEINRLFDRIEKFRDEALQMPYRDALEKLNKLKENCDKTELNQNIKTIVMQIIEILYYGVNLAEFKRQNKPKFLP